MFKTRLSRSRRPVVLPLLTKIGLTPGSQKVTLRDSYRGLARIGGELKCLVFKFATVSMLSERLVVMHARSGNGQSERVTHEMQGPRTCIAIYKDELILHPATDKVVTKQTSPQAQRVYPIGVSQALPRRVRSIYPRSRTCSYLPSLTA